MLRRRALLVSNKELTGFVDLGLPSGTLWAVGDVVKISQNKYKIGEPTERGAFFSWGNTDGHNEDETWDAGTGADTEPYVSSPGAALTSDIVIGSSYDTARATLGKPWHLPSKVQAQELIDNCDSSWTTVDGVIGRLYTSKINGNTIFFPGNGCRDSTDIIGKDLDASHWTLAIGTESGRAFDLYKATWCTDVRQDRRNCGFNVRAVFVRLQLGVLFYNTSSGTKKVFEAGDIIPDSSDGWVPIAIEVVPASHDRYGDGSGGFIALTCVKSDGTASLPTAVTDTDNQTMRWGASYDTSLTNFANIDGTNTTRTTQYQTNENGKALTAGNMAYPYTDISAETINSFANGAISDYDGVGNSVVLDVSIYDAAYACKLYITPGTYDGDWYLPALGELAYLPSIRYQINKTIQALNAIYGLVGRSLVTVSASYYWSSTERNSSAAHTVRMNNASCAGSGKTTNYYVRPFLRFPYNEYDPGDGYVDLGLPSGLLWAKGNIMKDSQGNYKIGKPTSYGSYFSWGNIIGHKVGEGYNFSNTNYQRTPGYSVDTDIPSNDAQHDAALACLGLPWHMPTKDNFQELIDYTDSEWTTIDGINGRKFMKKTDHNVFIFLPANGAYDGTTLSYRGEYISLWTASRNNSNGYDYYMLSGSSSIAIDDNSGRYGRCIRGVITP